MVAQCHHVMMVTQWLTMKLRTTGIAKQDLSNITDAGKNVITGLGTIVKAGDNVTVSEASDATTGQNLHCKCCNSSSLH